MQFNELAFSSIKFHICLSDQLTRTLQCLLGCSDFRTRVRAWGLLGWEIGLGLDNFITYILTTD